MSYFVVKNKAKRPLVFSLGNGETLRLPIDGETTIEGTQMTEHVTTLANKGHLVLTEKKEEKETKKK